MQTLDTDCTDKKKRLAAMKAAFKEHFGMDAELGVRAPGRVDLMGSHTDYNDGCVLTLPINRETWILARPREDGKVRIASLNMASEAEFGATNPELNKLDGWGQYVQGVAVELAQAGYRIDGCDALVHGTVPLSSGLSSSAALEAASATLFEVLGGFTLDPVFKARLTQKAENNWVGVNCGILDQYSSILGEQHKALMLDCRSLTHDYASVPPDLRIVICNTCAPRNLSGSEYGDRRAQCEHGAAFFADLDPGITALRDVSLQLFEAHESKLPTEVAKRSRFVIEENARVAELANALDCDDHRAIGEIMEASYAGARDLFEISVPAMDAMMDAMRNAPGVVGCRQAGAGFGGCMVALVKREKVTEFCEATADSYQESTGIKSEIYPVRTAPGAGVMG